jgi:hypothetical protein
MKCETTEPIFTARPSDTALQCAERFAREHWPEPRAIEDWISGKFRLKDGERWYEVRIAPGQRYGIYEAVSA